MAPFKRSLDEYLFADDSLPLDDSSIEILMVDQPSTDVYSSQHTAKKFCAGNELAPVPIDVAASTKKELATYLDFGFDASPSDDEFSVVPGTAGSAKDVVTAGETWLGSRPASPRSAAAFHELPGDDDWLSSGPSSPSSDLDFVADANGMGADALFGDSLFGTTFNGNSGDVMDRAAAGMLVNGGNSDETDASSIESVQLDALSPVSVTESSNDSSSKSKQSNAPALKATTKAAGKGAASKTATAKVTKTAADVVQQTKAKPLKTKMKGAGKSGSSSKPSSRPSSKPVSRAVSRAASPVAEEPVQKADANRWAHNSTERKRRCEIRRLFSDLRDLFPDLRGDDRVSNINTLSRAIQCVSDLDREAMEQAMSLHQLRERNASLKAAAAARNGGVLPSKYVTKKQRTTQKTQQVSDTYPQKLETREQTEEEMNLIALAAENPSLRRTLPLALRELLDHNGRGVYEAKPLPPRRPKSVHAK